MQTQINLDVIRNHTVSDYEYKDILKDLKVDGLKSSTVDILDTLENLGIKDFLWLLRHLEDEKSVSNLTVDFAFDCAERAVIVYEKKYSSNTPRKTLDLAKKLFSDGKEPEDWRFLNKSIATAHDSAFLAYRCPSDSYDINIDIDVAAASAKTCSYAGEVVRAFFFSTYHPEIQEKAWYASNCAIEASGDSSKEEIEKQKQNLRDKFNA